MKHLIQKIDTLQTNLKHDQKKHTEIQMQLKQAEIAIGNCSLTIKNTSKKLTRENEILQALKKKQDDNQQRLTEEKNNLNDDIRAAYLIGRTNYFKALLNQEDPNKISRLYVYYRCLLQNRIKTIAAITAVLQNIRQNDQKIKKQTKILQALYMHQKNERLYLEQVQKKRNIALKTIDDSLKTQQAKLQQLRADKQALERLIARINAKAKKLGPTIAGSLGLLRGKLLSPTSGTIAKSFGSSATELNGVIIAAKEDQEVHAIAKGQVVFADWLQGYGLMLIIDHGHGYMSLYGRNHNLYKKVGDAVEVSEVIATVGNSGGYEKTGLYFAMRYNGKPIDPTLWCKL